MSFLKWSSNKTDVTLECTKITLEFVRELASLVPAKCVGPIAGAALKLIDMIQVRPVVFLTSNSLTKSSSWQRARMNKEDCRELQEDLKRLMVVVLTPLNGQTDAEIQANPGLKENLDRLEL